MERLTFYDSFDEPCYKLDGTVYKNIISEHLAAYENTGMTPEEITCMAEEIETRFLIYLQKKYGEVSGQVMRMLEAYKQGKFVKYIPGDTVYDRFGMSWIVTSSEIHKFKEGPLRYLYRCGHPGTDDYCALYSEEILTQAEAERITGNE